MMPFSDLWKKKLILCMGLFIAGAVLELSAAGDLKEMGRQLQAKRLFNDLDSDIKRILEEREEYIKNAVSSGKLAPEAEKKIRKKMDKVRSRWAKIKERGSISTSLNKAIRRELDMIYTMIWFYSRNQKVFFHTLQGKKFYLKEPWQTNYQRQRVSERDMKEILRVIHLTNRALSLARHAEINKKLRLKDAAEQGEKILLQKYFSLEKPIEKPLRKGKRANVEKDNTRNQAIKNKIKEN